MFNLDPGLVNVSGYERKVLLLKKSAFESRRGRPAGATMHSRGNMFGSMGGADGYQLGSKRQRMLDGDPYFGPSGFHAATHAFGGGSHGGGHFPAVRLRGLPFICSESDVAEFFAGLDMVDVLLVRKQGRFFGEAYVVFGTQVQVDLALQRNRQNMGRRYVEVFRCKKQQYYNAIAAEVKDAKASANDDKVPAAPERLPVKPKASTEKDDMEHTGVLRLRGLPFSVSKRDIIDFFDGFDVAEENVYILTQSDGRATGEAFVKFRGPEESKSAMGKDKMTIGNRYIELFPSSSEEATSAATK